MTSRVLPLLALLGLAACDRMSSTLGIGGGPACPHDLALDRMPEIEVIASPPATKVRHDLSLEDVARLPGVENLGPGGKLQGMTVVHHQLSYKTRIAVSGHLFGGPKCAWLEKLTVDVSPGSMEIDVPSEYPEGSCEYDQILAHERSHDETHRDVLAQAAEDMRRALAKADYLPARGTPLAVADRPEAERRIEAMVDKATKPVYDGFKAELARRQAVIDLPENYRWTASRCSNWK